MKEPSKTNLLLPLGIGAGVLLLLAGMKNKASASTTAASPLLKANGDDSVPPSEEPVIPGQINPNPAPSYMPPAPSMTDTGDAFSDEGQEADGANEQDEEEQEQFPEEVSNEAGSYNSSYDDGHEAYTIPDEGMPPALRKQHKPVMGKQQKFIPLVKSMATGKPSMRTPGAMVNPSAAYRPGTNNPKQIRFDNRANQAVSYRPGATHQPAPQQKPTVVPAIKSNVVKAAPNANGKIFPLRMGMTNAYVKEVQRRIGVPATGYFGTMTLTALRSKFKVSEVSEVLYKQIMTGKAVVAQRAVVRKAPQRKVIQKGKPARKTATGKPANRYKSKRS